MQISNWIIFGAIEILVLLLIICCFLLFYARNLKGVIGKLQGKLKQAVAELKQSRQQCKALEEAASESGSSYSEMLDEQLDATREYHASLSPDQDIALDLNKGTPLPRQVASLRHAFLISEKEASETSEEIGRPNWATLQARLKNLISFFYSDGREPEGKTEPAPSEPPHEQQPHQLEKLREALADKDQQISNLEKFRSLFFDLEERWDAAQEEARGYGEVLRGFEVNGGVSQSEFDDLMDKYQSVYQDYGVELAEQAKAANSTSPALTRVVEVPGGTHPGAEVSRLKSIAANQHNLIEELQNRLKRAYSNQEKDQLIAELQQQLDQQVRYMQESETCIELMERELDQAQREMERLSNNIASMEAREENNAKLLKNANLLKQEHDKMIANIKNLQSENEQLVSQLQMLMASPTETPDNGATQKELKQLQKRYMDLENKYLAIKMQRS